MNEPSVVAVKRGDMGGSKILTAGKDARMMVGRTLGNIVAIRSMKDGVIADFEATETNASLIYRKSAWGKEAC